MQEWDLDGDQLCGLEEPMQEARIKTSACHFVFALAWSLQVQPGVFENSMATLTWKKQKGWRIQDVDGGMTWFRHDDLGAADPPTKGGGFSEKAMPMRKASSRFGWRRLGHVFLSFLSSPSFQTTPSFQNSTHALVTG